MEPDSLWRGHAGFTLIEVLIATALLGFSLIVMFGFHAQATISNRHARKITDCTYLAQNRMEQLLSLEWTGTNRPTDLLDYGSDTTASGTPWAWLPQPAFGAQPTGVNAAGNADITFGQLEYFLTWDVEDQDVAATWTLVRVRCSYEDQQFNTWRGTTISSFKYRDQ